jgi:hypothetical protein
MPRTKLALGAFAFSLLATVVHADTEADRQTYGRLLLEEHALRNLMHLAQPDSFYVVLDIANDALFLMYRGVPLREFEPHEIEIGRPRRVFRTSPAPEDWLDHIYTGGIIDPPPERTDKFLGASADSTGFDPDWTPLSPEELIPNPARFRIEYDRDVVLEVMADSTGDAKLSFKDRLVDGFHALVGNELRVRLRLTPEEAGTLYRALPQGSKLAVVTMNPIPERPASPNKRKQTGSWKDEPVSHASRVSRTR